MTHFHVTLPSDSSLDTYPNNTTSRFTVKLPDRIVLDDEYEVGLAEFIYPHTWFNFDNSDERYFTFVILRDGTTRKYVYRSAYYPDGVTFAIDLNQQIAKALNEVDFLNPTVKFTFNPSTMKMSLSHNSRHRIIFSPKFLKYLGFSGTLGPIPKLTTVASNILELKSVKNLMYIYCDVASYSIVGDLETPLLRVCNTSGKDGDMVRSIFTHPHYVPVARNEFETIEINISDELGRPIPFLHGKSMVTLHFRARK